MSAFSAYSESMQDRPSRLLGAPEEFVARHVGNSIQVKPVPVASLRRPGSQPFRVLMFGGGPLVGAGLRDHNVGLPGHVADQLAAATRRGIEMDVVADPEPVRRTAVEGLQGLRLWRYDAIVAVLGEPTAKQTQHDQAYWASELVRVLLVEGDQAATRFVYDSSATAPVARSPWARGASRSTQAQRDAAERACVRTGQVRFGELAIPRRTPPEGQAFDSAQYEEWAEVIVHRLVQQRDAQGPLIPATPIEAPHPDDEYLRQRALNSLRMTQDPNPRLEEIVRSARALFGTASAAINIIDDDVQWSKAAVNGVPVLPREQAFCNQAIQVDGSTLINDSRLDGRFVANPLRDQVVFYAGHPIRTWDGYRIGALCVFGPEPRKMRPSELEPLRDLAGLVEQELWSNALNTRVRGH